METASPNEPLQTLRVNINIHPNHSIGDDLSGTPTTRDPGGSTPLSDIPRSERGQHADGHAPGSPHSPNSSSPSSGNGNAETSVCSGSSSSRHETQQQPPASPSYSSQPTHFRPWLAPSKPPSGGHKPHHPHPYRRISTTNQT